jgi:hypothetical protein
MAVDGFGAHLTSRERRNTPSRGPRGKEELLAREVFFFHFWRCLNADDGSLNA